MGLGWKEAVQRLSLQRKQKRQHQHNRKQGFVLEDVQCCGCACAGAQRQPINCSIRDSSAIQVLTQGARSDYTAFGPRHSAAASVGLRILYGKLEPALHGSFSPAVCRALLDPDPECDSPELVTVASTIVPRWPGLYGFLAC